MDENISSRQLVWEGFLAIVPLMFGVAPFGLVYGALATEAGLTMVEALGMSVFVLAGSSQFVAVRLIETHTPAFLVVFTTFIINLRHSLYSASLTDFEKHPMIHRQILSSLGYAYEQQKDYSTAVGYFEKISVASGQILRDEALFHMGRLYDKLGQPEKSKEAYQKILSDHPDFIYIDMVKERISG